VRHPTKFELMIYLDAATPIGFTIPPPCSPARLGAPGGNRLLSEPHRQIAALVQARFIGWPIRQPALLLRDVVATLGRAWRAAHFVLILNDAHQRVYFTPVPTVNHIRPY
jgi:hypothetical protein